jgi:PIN domain nuclease of toxin-antitoxin system
MTALVLDAGALIALERRDRRMLALLREVIDARVSAHVTAGVVAQLWRGTARQHAVVRLLRSQALRIHPLTEAAAYRVGFLLAASRTSDVIDAHVALLGRSLGAVVLTSDADDLRRLDPDLRIVTV